MNLTLGLALLFILVGVLIYTTIYYARTANVRKYAAGKAFMTLLVSLDLLVGYSTFARFFPLEVRTQVFSVLIAALIGAVIFIQRVMRHEYLTYRTAAAKAFVPRDADTDEPDKSGEHNDD